MLREHEPELKGAGGVRLSLFRSTARGEAGPESDVDLLAGLDKSRRLSLLDVVCLEVRLADLLGVKVDLLIENLRDERLDHRLTAHI